MSLFTRSKSATPHALALRLTPVALAAAVAAMPAHAQTADSTESQKVEVAQASTTTPQASATAPETSKLEAVVVTARKVKEKLQEVPVSVVSFSPTALKDLGVSQVKELAAATPGLYVQTAVSAPSALNLSLRGQYQNDTLITLEPSVGVYVDDMYWARAYGLNANFLDVQSVQVLKGPQGTLFGRNTTGGALVLTSKDPSADVFGGSAEATFGSFNQRAGTLILNVPLKENVAAFRVAVNSDKRDGYATDIVSGRKYGSRDNTQARVKLALYPTEALAVVLSAEVADQKSNGVAMFTALSGGLLRSGVGGPTGAAGSPGIGGLPAGVAGLDKYVNDVNDDPSRGGLNDYPDGSAPHSNAKTQTYTAKATLDTAAGQLKLILGTRHVTQDYVRDLDGSPYNVLIVKGSTDAKQESAELQLTGTALSKTLDYAVGTTWFTESGTDRTNASTFGGASSFSNNQGTIDNKSLGAYGQASYHATKEWSFTAGLRYSKDDKGLTVHNGTINAAGAFTSCLQSGAGPILNASLANDCAASRSDTFSNTSYTIGTDYKLSADQMVYGKFSTGYRSGAQNLRAATTAQFAPAQPELVKEFEVGYKGDLLDRTFRFNLAAYASQLKNAQRSLIVLLAPGSTQTQTLLTNAATMKNTGLEIDMQAVLSSSLTASLGLSLQDPKYDSYTFQGVDHTDDRIMGTSKKQVSLGLDYKIPTTFGRVKLHADYSWRSAYALSDTQGTPFSPTNLAGYNLSGVTPAQFIDATTAPASGVVNARASLTMNNGWDVAVWALNLGNDRSRVSGLLVPSLFYSAVYREPRTYGVTASYRF